MRILHIIPTLGCGGAEVLVGTIALEQVKQGHEVKILLTEGFLDSYSNYPLKDHLEKINLIEIVLEKFNFDKKAINNKLINFIHLFDPEVIHTHLYISELIAQKYYYSKANYVSHFHNNIKQFDFQFNKGIKRALTDFREVRWLFKKYKISKPKFITISKNSLKYYQQKFPRSLFDSINLLQNSINIKRYLIEKKLFNTKLIKLISIGSLLENKNHITQIKLIQFLVQKNYPIELDILGDGPEYYRLIKLVEELKLTDRINFRGAVSNPEYYLSQADIFIHTAYSEAFGLVILEAMAAQVPVVILNGQGNKDLIQHGVNGFVFEQNEIDAFYEMIINLIEDEKLRISTLGNAFNFSKKYDISLYVKKLDLIYCKIQK